ncbi:MAG: preprotein translocase subunit YajC [Saccharospirillaceae bacterium]|nr:preprotein translocase subunit YajC [Pseudomonadales bacterium]NRB77959.1 preprotein translocase subunit YajC [Saccharospirillaceae bacterium]
MLKRTLSLLTVPAVLLSSCGPTASADGSAAPQGGGMSMLVMFGGLGLMMYFMMIRPQQKKAKEHKALMSAISKGDEVLTTAGILGKVNKITDEYATIETGDGVLLTIQKGHITNTLPKGTIKTYKANS